MTPAANASPAPVVLMTCSGARRTEPCRHTCPPGIAATAPAGKCTTASEETPRSISPRASASMAAQSTGVVHVRRRRSGAGQGTGLQLVDDDRVEVRQARPGHHLQALRRQRGQLEVGVQARRLGRCQEPGPAAGTVRVRLLHERMEAQVADMQDARPTSTSSLGSTSNRPFVPRYVKNVRRPPSRSTITSVKAVVAPSRTRTRPVSMASPAQASRMNEPSSSSATHPRSSTSNGRTESPQVHAPG